MPTKVWRGDAQARAQESRATPANVEIGDIFTLIVNQKEISFTATVATVANVTAGLAAAWSASTEPEAVEITATDMTTYVKLTAAAGLPFTVTSSTTNGGGANTQTLTMSTPTNATGPNHWDDADNWAPNGVPVAADDVILENSRVAIKYGLAQSAVTLTSFTQHNTYEAEIGLPNRNDNGYFEYRATELAISATTFNLGIGEGNGSGRIKINSGAVAGTINCRGTGSGLETGIPAALWRGTNAGNVVNVTKGHFGIGYQQGQAATVATLRVGYETNVLGDARVECGTGVTLGTNAQTGGYLLTNSAITTHQMFDGELVHQAGTLGTLECDRGVVRYRSNGTMTTARIGSDAELDFRQDPRPVTVTNTELHAGATLRDPGGRVTFTNGIDLYRCSPLEVTLDLAPHKNIALSAA